MAFDRVGIYRAQGSENKFIIVIGNEPAADTPLHASDPLARDEAKNLLRHYNLSDSEIDLRLQKASALSSSAAAGA
ncbi:MAG: hypothetical protein M3Y57_09180 [Acidobacteriota bacterium]|nr:hypothetical protein [Acidobacteriota bacterium]